MSKIPTLQVGVLYADYIICGTGYFTSVTVNGVPISGQTLDSAGGVALTQNGALQVTTFNLRGLVAGPGIAIDTFDDHLTISNTGGSSSAPTLNNAQAAGGAVFSLLRSGAVQPTGGSYFVRTLTAGANMTITPAGNDIVFEATGAAGGSTLALEAAATGESIVGASTTPNAHFFQGLTGTADISVTTAVGVPDVTIALNPSGAIAGSYTNVTATVNASGLITDIFSGATGTGGASTGASFVTVLPEADLSAERLITPEVPFVGTDNGATNTYDLALDSSNLDSLGDTVYAYHMERLRRDAATGTVTDYTARSFWSLKRPLRLYMAGNEPSSSFKLPQHTVNERFLLFWVPAFSLETNRRVPPFPWGNNETGIKTECNFAVLGNAPYSYDRVTLRVNLRASLMVTPNPGQRVNAQFALLMRHEATGLDLFDQSNSVQRCDSEHSSHLNLTAYFVLLKGISMLDKMVFQIYRFAGLPEDTTPVIRLNAVEPVMDITIVDKYRNGT